MERHYARQCYNCDFSDFCQVSMSYILEKYSHSRRQARLVRWDWKADILLLFEETLKERLIGRMPAR